MSFFKWLVEQTGRQDGVGAFARYAVRDKVFPGERSNRLGVFLSRYEGMPEQREAVKVAHREWRQTRRGGAVR